MFHRSFVALLAWLALTATAFADEKPNILFVFADDYAFDAVGGLGNDEVKTPHIDRLIKRGTTFTHAYNQGGWHGAVCVASRTMLVTGQYLWNAKKTEETQFRNKKVPNPMVWPQLLAKEGYDTYFTGKWHIQLDANEVFDVARHIRPGMPNQTPSGYNRPVEGQPLDWLPWDKSKGGFWKGGKHWSEIVADDARDYLTIAGKSDNPFFMYIAFNAPHDPRQAPKEYVDMYPLDKISLPQPFYKDYPLQIGCNRIRDEKLAPFPRTEYAVKVNRQEYYAIITHLDAQIGRILDALEKSGKAKNTYIVFTADHGLGCGHHGLMGKQNMFDHSVRVPFVVVGPDIPADHRIDARIYLQDVMPTTLELAGATKPETVQFKSFLPLIQGKAKQSYDSIYGAYVDFQRMVTMGQDKLIIYPKINERLLFDLSKDPLETKNLIDDPAHASKVASLLAKLSEWQKRTGDTLDISKK